MKTIIEQKREVGFFSVNDTVIAEKKRHSNLEDFLKGTISGEDLVKHVCDKLEEKYGKNQLGRI